MIAQTSARLFVLLLFCLGARPALAQTTADSPNDSVRVSVTLNQDGSRTVYHYDPAQHKATATTTTREGKPAGKIQYELDDAGRFGRGRIFGPDGQFRFRTVYKYDGAGRLQEESRFGQDDKLANKLVYSYDASGKQTGYSIFDGAGKLLGQTSPALPAASAKPRPGGR